jgi:hypothetical protein
MATLLKQVLVLFELSSQPLTLPEMARILGVEPGMLEAMIEYWVRKGRIREAGDTAGPCVLCGTRTECPFVAKLPRRYELAIGVTLRSDERPPCACCS